MRNRAKCKLCQSIIESFHPSDFVTCKCGEIFVDGGADDYRCGAGEWSNFLRVDDQGNEIVVKVTGDVNPLYKDKPNKKELIDMLDGMIKNIEGLPPQAMHTSVTQFDLASALLLVSAIFRADCKESS